MKKNSIFLCKRMKLFTYLCEKGFVPYKTAKDENNPKYTVWMYNRSDRLNAAIEEYFNR